MVAKTEPAQLRVGDTWSWRRSLPAYPASAGWTLSYELVKQGQRIAFDATADGDDHLVLVPATETTGKAAGVYQWLARAKKGAEVYSLAQGTVDLLPDYSAAVDARSHARKVLDAIEAVLENRASRDQEEYTIGNRSLKRTPIGDLLRLRDRYRQDLALEEAADRAKNGLPSGKRILVRFR